MSLPRLYAAGMAAHFYGRFDERDSRIARRRRRVKIQTEARPSAPAALAWQSNRDYATITHVNLNPRRRGGGGSIAMT